MKTIGRNQTVRLALIWANATDAKVHCLQNYFIAEPVDVTWVKKQFESFPRSKLYQDGPNAFRLRCHSNEWYVFRSVTR